MISAGDDGLIRIWCLKTGLMVSSLRGHTVLKFTCFYIFVTNIGLYM